MDHRGIHARKKPASYVLTLLIFGLALLSAGCVTLKDPQASQVHAGDLIANVQAEHTVGQSFLSHRPGFNGLDIWLNLSPDSNKPDGKVIFELFQQPGDEEPIAITLLDFSQIAASSPVYVSFSIQTPLAEGSYYLSMRTVAGVVEARGRNEDIYPHGSAFINGKPVGSDLAFRTSYDYNYTGVLEDIKTLLINLWLVLPLALILWLPGWFLLSVTKLGKRFDSGERLALSIGLSMAIIPLLMMWTSWIGLAWSRISIWVVVVLICLYALWQIFKKGYSFSTSKIDSYLVALAGVFMLTLFVRIVMVRDLFASPWVDSIHHGMITRLIVESGSYPDTYAPYLNLDSSRYHPGFHSLLASFLWLSNLDLERAMLIFGQVLNALIVFPVYLFTKTLTRDKGAAVIAALIAGLFSPMPAYYTSWGRYTQLAALLILPVAFVWIRNLQSRPSTQYNSSDSEVDVRGGWPNKRIEWKMLLIAGIASAGLFLTHYRIAAFLACLIAADFLSHIYPRLKQGLRWNDLFKDLAWIALTGLLALLLVLPWLPSTVRNLFIPMLSLWRGGNATPFGGFVWSFLTTALGTYTLVLAALGLLLGFFQRRWFTMTLILWVVMLFFLANVDALGLPGGGFITNLAVEITLFLPISVLGGYFIGQLVSLWAKVIPQRWHRVYDFTLTVTVIFLSVIAARHLIPILNPITFLYREADTSALTWIQDNLPADETVMINPFSWGYGFYAGNDGGYWITPLTGLKTMPPPVLYGLDHDLRTVQAINDLNQQVIEAGRDAEALYSLLSEAGIHYVYLGGRGGPISPLALQTSPLYQLLYNQDGTWLFKVIPSE
jgi:hypothetical protein